MFSRLREHPEAEKKYTDTSLLDWDLFERLMTAGVFGEEPTDLSRLINLDTLSAFGGTTDVLTHDTGTGPISRTCGCTRFLVEFALIVIMGCPRTWDLFLLRTNTFRCTFVSFVGCVRLPRV